MVDYFTEVFPIDVSKIGQLTAYKVEIRKGSFGAVADDLLMRFGKAFSGHWVVHDGNIITDNAPSPIQIEITLDLLKNEFPERFQHIEAITECADWYPTAEDAANFIAQACIQTYDATIRQELKTHGVRVNQGYVMRDYLLQGWEVDGQPALSFTLKSRVLYLQNVDTCIKNDLSVIGLQAIDKTNGQNIGVIEALSGKVNDKRQVLLNNALSPAQQALIEAAPDDENVVTLAFKDFKHEYIGSSLNLILQAENFEDFGIHAASINKAIQLAPVEMAKIVSAASDVLKNNGIIGNAYNNRVNAQHFIYLDHVPEMEFGSKAVRPYKIETLANEFTTHGLFGKHPRFKETPIKIAVINTLESTIATDFVEAMRRQLEKDFGLAIEMIKARNVRVVSEKNLASAIRVVEKENPHVLIACFADNQADSYNYVHSLTLGKGIALQALYENTMHNPEAMGWIIMGVLAKTGNTPFVLAEPFEAANLVVGLDWVRETMTRSQRVVGMSRVYRRDGYFMRYFMDIQELDLDTSPELEIIKSLFPAPIFMGKRVLIQHHGTLSPTLINLLRTWEQEIDAHFMILEIHTEQVPYVYALEGGISQAPWGSVYLLNTHEAFVVSSSPDTQIMPETIHIRIRHGDITIEQAIYSVLALTLLNYGTMRIPRLPVTIQNADRLAEWLGRGMLPNNINGDVAFWL